MTSTFAPGDVVRQVGDDQLMTVEAVDVPSGDVECVWFEDAALRKGVRSASTLEKASKDVVERTAEG